MTRREQLGGTLLLAGLAGVLVLWQNPTAASDAEISSDQAWHALQLASLGWRTTEWPELTLRSREQLAGTVNEDARVRISREASRAFEAASLQRRTWEELLASDPRKAAKGIRSLLGFYGEAPGAGLAHDRAVVLESSSLSGLAPFVAERLFQPEALQEGDVRRRRELLRRLDQALGLTNDFLTVGSAIAQALDTGGFLARCKAPPPALGDSPLESVEWARPFVQGRVRVVLDYAHRERDLSDLAAEMRFAESAQGSRALRAVSSALEAALEQASRDFVVALLDQSGCER